MKTKYFFLGFAALLFVCLVGAFISTPPARASTTITVNTSSDVISDDGSCSLREAIRAANLDAASGATVGECPAGSGADTIIVPAGTYSLTIAGANENGGLTGDLDITSTVAISGAGVGVTTITGNGLDRVLHIAGAVTATVSDLMITGGNTTGLGNNGAGINVNNGSILILTNTAIISNTSQYGGGGVSNDGTLTITSSSISENLAFAGGGITNGGIMVVTGTIVSSNTATQSGGGIYTGYGSVTLMNSLISGNNALFYGGIQNSGNTGKVIIINSGISRNVATGIGGGIANGPGSMMTLMTVTVLSNIAQHGSGGITNSGILTLTDSSVISNSSGERGGGISTAGLLTVINSTVSGNEANGDGGGISSASTVVYLNNVTIANNVSDKDNNGSGGGGGVIHYGPLGLVHLKNTIIAGNTRTNGQASDCAAPLFSEGNNLIQSITGCDIVNASADITNTVALLGPLQSSGGPTLTHALLPGSPAIDAGDNATCAATDQRGAVRPFDGDGNGNAVCDIGAYEFGAVIPNAWLYLPLIMRGP